MKSNTSHKYLVKPLTNIIIVMQNIGFTTSSDRTKITPEKLGERSDKMSHDPPTIWSLVSNGLFSSIVITQKLLSSGKIHVYRLDICGENVPILSA